MAIFPHPVATAAFTADGLVGQIATITLPAPGAGQSIYLCSVSAGYDGAGIGSLTINVATGGFEWKRWIHNVADILFTFANRCGANQPVTIELAAIAGRIGTVSGTYRIGPS